jgi:hypothetical protein
MIATVISIQLSSARSSQLPSRGVIRLRVRPKIKGTEKGLSRKRFFLIKGSIQDHQGLLESINRSLVPSRECYYQGISASKELIEWLKLNDCDSVYCREIEQKYVEGTEAVPEFRDAYQKGLKEFGSRELARKWITNNLREEVRIGYYKLKQEALGSFIKQAEAASKAEVKSVMTDLKGAAYFTEVEPATYIITNILPSEIGSDHILWVCEYVMTPQKLDEERVVKLSNLENEKLNRLDREQIIKLSNQENKKLKCRFVEQPSGPCDKALK